MRKKLLLLLNVIPILIYSQGIVFYQGSFEELKQEALKQSKIIFIDCYTNWCGPCKWLAKNVFTNKQVGDYYNEHFINYSLDMEKGEGKDIAKKYTISAYPTLLFIDGYGNLVHRYVGACDTATFINIGKMALDTLNNFGKLYKEYQSGNRNPEFLAKYALQCANVYLPYNIDEYFATQSEKDLFSAMNIQIMERYYPNIHSREFAFLVKNIDSLILLHGFERIYSLVTQIINRTFYIQSTTNNKFDPSKEIDILINKLHVSNINFWSSCFLQEFYLYYKVKKYDDFIQQFPKTIGYAPNERYKSKILDIIVNHLETKITDTTLLEKAIFSMNPFTGYISSKSLIRLVDLSLKIKQTNFATQFLSLIKVEELNQLELQEYHQLKNKLK